MEECNLHTIIRLPNSVFQPYATIATNLLFFEKGNPTKEVWYYEHRIPEGQKSYSKTKPIRMEEFNPIRLWWNNRSESDVCWKVKIQSILEKGFDLDIKNPSKKTSTYLFYDEALRNFDYCQQELNLISQELSNELSQLKCNEDLTRVINHLNLITEDANGIFHMKSLIINLGVQGRLVEQSSEDGSAMDLLIKIKEEKDKLQKKEVLLPPIKENEKPFDIPENWIWCRLGTITNYGSSPKANPSDIKENTWVLDLEDIEKDTSKLLGKERFENRKSLSSKSIFKRGEVLYSKLRPYLDKVIVADEDGVCTTEILPLHCYSNLNPYFLRFSLKNQSFLTYVNSVTKGMKMPRLGTHEGRMALIPIAPAKEQQRIVTKIDHLLKLCDELERCIQKEQKCTQELLKVVVKDVRELKREN